MRLLKRSRLGLTRAEGSHARPRFSRAGGDGAVHMLGVLLPSVMLHNDGMPGMYEVMYPILKICSDGRVRNGDALTHEVANWFELTTEQRLVTTRGGNQLQIKDRTLWAVTHLCRAELLYKPRRGLISITEAGRKLAEDNNVLSITSHDLMAIPSYALWKLQGAAPSVGRTGSQEGGQLDVLKMRLARGEMTVEEYAKIKEVLENS